MIRLNRGTLRYQAKRSGDNEIQALMKRASERHPRWGFGKIYVWMRYQGHPWNHKKIRRIYREMKLHIRVKPKKQIPSRNPKPLEEPTMIGPADEA